MTSNDDYLHSIRTCRAMLIGSVAGAVLWALLLLGICWWVNR